MTLQFLVTFHAPFAVSAGVADRGFDATIDQDRPLPASSLKGVMKAAARRLGVSGEVVRQVYGATGTASAWAWSDATFLGDGITVHRAARIALTPSGVVEAGRLALLEQAWATQAVYTVDPTRSLGPARADHEIVLRASARHVVSLGAGRRRGSGWVTIADDTDWTAEDTSALLRLRRAAL